MQKFGLAPSTSGCLFGSPMNRSHLERNSSQKPCPVRLLADPQPAR